MAPNLAIFVPASPRLIASARRANHFRWLLRMGWTQSLIKSRAAKTVRGSDAGTRERLQTLDLGLGPERRRRDENHTHLRRQPLFPTVSGALAVVGFLIKPHARR